MCSMFGCLPGVNMLQRARSAASAAAAAVGFVKGLFCTRCVVGSTSHHLPSVGPGALLSAFCPPRHMQPAPLARLIAMESVSSRTRAVNRTAVWASSALAAWSAPATVEPAVSWAAGTWCHCSCFGRHSVVRCVRCCGMRCALLWCARCAGEAV